MQAVILAGGLGTRLRPLTLDVPKPMVPVRGRPYLEYQIRYLKSFELTDIVLCIGYLGDKVVEYFGDGSRCGVNISYSHEQQPMGTGGALHNARDLLDGQFFLIYGDSFLPIDYAALEASYRALRKLVLLVAYGNQNDTSVPNNISVESSGLVTKYMKGSRDPDLRFVEAGVSVVGKKVLDLMPPRQTVSLEEEIFPVLIGMKECGAYITRDRFYDIGTPTGLEVFAEYAGINLPLPDSGEFSDMHAENMITGKTHPNTPNPKGIFEP